MPTIRDVAREAGVSIATVSYVLNDRGAVSVETRKRVLDAVTRLRYHPSIIARNLRARESRIVGYSWRPVPPDQFNPVLEKFIHAIAEAAARHAYHVLAFAATEGSDEVTPYREMVDSLRVDGFVLSNTNRNDPRVRYLMDSSFPFVAFGRSNPEWEYAWVDVDGADGTNQAATHLLELGHRRVACLAWPEDSLSGEDRLSGYRRAMERAGLPVEESWIVRSENSYLHAYRATQTWLGMPPEERPTAVVAVSDLLAIGVMNAAADAGLKVGPDLAVTGFDDAPITGYLQPGLTSVRQPIAEIGERLVTMLIDVVHGEMLTPMQILLKPRLIARNSTMLSARV